MLWLVSENRKEKSRKGNFRVDLMLTIAFTITMIFNQKIQHIVNQYQWKCQDGILVLCLPDCSPVPGSDFCVCPTWYRSMQCQPLAFWVSDVFWELLLTTLVVIRSLI